VAAASSSSQAVLLAQKTFRDQRRARIAAQLAPGVKRRHQIQIGPDQIFRRAPFAHLPNPLDAAAPFAATGRFGTVEIISAGPGMGIDDPESSELEAQVKKYAHKNRMFVHIGEIPGMKGVAIIHGRSRARVSNFLERDSSQWNRHRALNL
jgi:hypothetical protein